MAGFGRRGADSIMTAGRRGCTTLVFAEHNGADLGETASTAFGVWVGTVKVNLTNHPSSSSLSQLCLGDALRLVSFDFHWARPSPAELAPCTRVLGRRGSGHVRARLVRTLNPALSLFPHRQRGRRPPPLFSVVVHGIRASDPGRRDGLAVLGAAGRAMVDGEALRSGEKGFLQVG